MLVNTSLTTPVLPSGRMCDLIECRPPATGGAVGTYFRGRLTAEAGVATSFIPVIDNNFSLLVT